VQLHVAEDVQVNRRNFLALASGLLIPEPTRVYSFLWDDEAAYRRSVIESFKRECIEEWERQRETMSAFTAKEWNAILLEQGRVVLVGSILMG
jgi:hypothetical protein